VQNRFSNDIVNKSFIDRSHDHQREGLWHIIAIF